MDKIRLRITRLSKEQNSLNREPLENAFVKRNGDLNFYFCLFNLEDDFKNGFYFGLLQLHPEYPFYAPKLFIYTPNGRYEQNLAICTSFTNYHQQSWTSAWNVRSLIQATISFMYANEPSYGCRADPPQVRKKYARDSLTWNFNNDMFQKMFGQTIRSKLPDIVKLGIQIYDRQIILQLRRLGLESENSKHLSQSSPSPQKNVYHHPISQLENPFKQLNRPLIPDHQFRQIQQELDPIRLENNQEIQRENRRLINEENRRKRQKAKKIMKIIGVIGVATALGIFLYYSWSKPTATQASNLQTTFNQTKKQGGFLDLVCQFPKNLMQMVSNLMPRQSQKIMVNNS